MTTNSKLSFDIILHMHSEMKEKPLAAIAVAPAPPIFECFQLSSTEICIKLFCKCILLLCICSRLLCHHILPERHRFRMNERKKKPAKRKKERKENETAQVLYSVAFSLVSRAFLSSFFIRFPSYLCPVLCANR